MLRAGPAAAQALGGRGRGDHRLRRRVHRHAGQLPQLRQRADAARQLAPLAGAAARPARRPAPRRRAAARCRRPTTSSSPTRAGSLGGVGRRGRRARRPGTRGARGPRGVALFVVDRGALLRQALVADDRRPVRQRPAARLPTPSRSRATTPPMSAAEAPWRADADARPSTRTRPRRGGAPRAAAPSACAGRRRWPAAAGRSASRCASGAPSRACPTPTTRTRTRTSCPRPSGCSATAGTRTTSSTRRPTRTCCTSSSRSGSAAARACRTSFARDPTEVFLVARVVAAACGTIAVWLLYLAGAKLFADRRVGFLAAGLLGVALPAGLLLAPGAQRRADAGADLPGAVRHGGHRAPGAAASTTCSAGAGVGLACATKYTGGIALLPLLAAAAGLAACGRRRLRGRRSSAGSRSPALRALVALRRRQPVRAAGLQRVQRRAEPPDLGRRRRAGQARPDRGQRAGLLPVDADLGPGLGPGDRGARSASCCSPRDDWRIAAVLVPGAGAVPAVHGHPGALLRPLADAGLPDDLPAGRLRRAADRAGASAGGRPGAGADAAGRSRPRALCGQGLVYSLHIGQVLSRADTRNLARAWMVAHVPPRTKIVVEPVVPDGWAQDVGHPSPLTANGNRWVKYPTCALQHRQRRLEPPGPGRDRQHRGLRAHAVPGLVDQLRAAGLLLGRRRLDAARPRRGRARGGAAGAGLLPGARAPGRHVVRRPRRTARAPSRSTSTSTGRSTSTRWPTTGPGPTMSIYHLAAAGAMRSTRRWSCGPSPVSC